MKQRSFFIVSLSWVDWLTMSSLLLSVIGLLCAFHENLPLAIVFMLLAMFVDMLDGLLARRFRLDSEFGRYLDGFCDVFTYLLLPLFILYQFGMQDMYSVTVLFIFLVCGLLRLSRFNIVGTVEEKNVQFHVGLQVIWSQLVVVFAFPAWSWLGSPARYPLMLVLLIMSFFMVRNILVPKPIQYTLLTVIILSVAGVYTYLHFSGVRTP